MVVAEGAPNPSMLRIFHEPKDRMRLTVGESHSYVAATPIWAAPLSQPRRYLAFIDGKGKEIVLVERLEQLDLDSRAAVETELKRRYLTATIKAIIHAKVEFGATYWTVRTDRGEREMVTQSLQENAQWLGEHQLLLVDVDGNRFEIPDVRTLDEISRRYIGTIL